MINQIINIYLFIIWQCHILIGVCGIFHLHCMCGIYFLDQRSILGPCIGSMESRSLGHQGSSWLQSFSSKSLNDHNTFETCSRFCMCQQVLFFKIYIDIHHSFIYNIPNWKATLITLLGEGNDNPLQYSCLENPMDAGPGGLQSMGLLGVGHDWATSLSLFTFMQWRRKWQPTPVFLPGESQGRGSLVGRHLWGCTESDRTEVT